MYSYSDVKFHWISLIISNDFLVEDIEKNTEKLKNMIKKTLL